MVGAEAEGGVAAAAAAAAAAAPSALVAVEPGAAAAAAAALAGDDGEALAGAGLEEEPWSGRVTDGALVIGGGRGTGGLLTEPALWTGPGF